MDKPHRKLDVWKLAIQLVIEVYKITMSLPIEETYNLANQMKRCAVSNPSNIAEGAARNTKKEFINFLHIARGSMSELDTHIEIAKQLGYLYKKDINTINILMERVDRMLAGLIKSQIRLTSNVLHLTKKSDI